MPRTKPLAVVALVAGLIVALGPATAGAAPPSNDTFAGATVIPSLPYGDTLGMGEATVDADDASLGLPCPGDDPALTFTRSIWFAYTPPEDQEVGVNTSGSSSSHAISIVTGAPGALSPVPGGCFTDVGSVALAAHTTYYIVVSEYPGAPSARFLSFHVSLATTPELVATYDRVGRWVAGTGVLSGTASCFPGAAGNVGVTMKQSGPRNTTIGGQNDFAPELVCDGTPHRWSITVVPSDSDFPFRRGNAIAEFTLAACTDFICEELRTTREVKLKEDRSGPHQCRGKCPPKRSVTRAPSAIHG
jgi:hypothetical protein